SGISDTHVARDQQVGALVDLLVGDLAAGVDRVAGLLLGKRILGGDVTAAAPDFVSPDLGGQRVGVHGEVDHPHGGSGDLGEHVDRSTSGRHVGDHLRGDFRGVGRYAGPGHTVVAGE